MTPTQYGPWQQVLLRRENQLMRSVELARAAGISRGYMSDLEAGRKFPSRLVTAKIAKALDTTPAAIARSRWAAGVT